MYIELLLSAILSAASLLSGDRPAADNEEGKETVATAGSTTWTVRGKILDAQTGEEIIGAAVMVKDNPDRWAVSGLDGSFSVTLDVSDGTGTLV